MRKNLVLVSALAALSMSAFAQTTSTSHFAHPDAIATYLLKDGNTLYVYKDGKMAMENKVGNAVHMKDGVAMETKDGKKIMMVGNEIWRVESHRIGVP